LDGLNQLVWLDDAQICDLRVRKIYSESPGLVIEIEQILTGVFA
jgi:Holliday junction resolvase RusA-like endonuclease